MGGFAHPAEIVTSQPRVGPIGAARVSTALQHRNPPLQRRVARALNPYRDETAVSTAPAAGGGLADGCAVAEGSRQI